MAIDAGGNVLEDLSLEKLRNPAGVLHDLDPASDVAPGFGESLPVFSSDARGQLLEVILEERRSRVDNNPGGKLREMIQASLFLNHPYRIPVIGWEHEIHELSTETALAFYRRWYAPNNAVLIVGGDITAAELRPLAEKYYGAIPARAAHCSESSNVVVPTSSSTLSTPWGNTLRTSPAISPLSIKT